MTYADNLPVTKPQMVEVLCGYPFRYRMGYFVNNHSRTIE